MLGRAPRDHAGADGTEGGGVAERTGRDALATDKQMPRGFVPQHTNIWSTQLLVDYAASRDKQHVRERLSRHDDSDPPHTRPGNMHDKL